MRIKLKKLNSKGFAHHLLIPVAAIVIVAGIGTYIITKSHAQTIDPTGSWHTLEAHDYDRVVSVAKNNSVFFSYTFKAGIKYRVCANLKSNISGKTAVGYIAPNSSATYSIGNTIAQRCQSAFTLNYGGVMTPSVNPYSDSPVLVKHVEVQRYY
jgi:hypothetical protein